MFNCVIALRHACNHFCNENQETRPYLLSPAEWDQAANIMSLLQPLSEATHMLCASSYPTLNMALPIYIVLLKTLRRVQHGLYDQAQLIQPATNIIKKIEGYFVSALRKPIYICAMILDPTIKANFWKKNESFMVEYYQMPLDQIIKTFQEMAACFEDKSNSSEKSKTTPTIARKTSSKTPELFSSELYEPMTVLDLVSAEINQYLKEDPEPQDTQPLGYWATRQTIYPILSQMARHFLSIPATSAASERVFSKGRRIVSWQRSSLQPESIEKLLCLKEWYKFLNYPN